MHFSFPQPLKNTNNKKNQLLCFHDLPYKKKQKTKENSIYYKHREETIIPSTAAFKKYSALLLHVH